MGNSKVDLMELPLGTRFYVINGDWYGRVCGSIEDKKIFVEYTRKTYPLRADHGLTVNVVDDD